MFPVILDTLHPGIINKRAINDEGKNMRLDTQGMLWFEVPKEKGSGKVCRLMPPIPETGWRPPTHMPDLSNAVLIAIDVETKDPELLTRGPGWARNVGHIVGISIAAVDSLGNVFKSYYPFKHEIEAWDNLEQEPVYRWLRVELGREWQPKVGANITYDVGWLRHEGIPVKGRLHDVQFAEALLSESRPTNLEALGQHYLGEGKESNQLYEWCAAYYGGAATGRQRANIYRSPPRLVGFYAESDVDLPLRLHPVMQKALLAEDLLPVYDMECGLIPLMIDMRFAGARVDVDKAEVVSDQLQAEENRLQAELNDKAGFKVNVNAGASLHRLFDNCGVKYPYTDKGNPSFTKSWLKDQTHPAAEYVKQIRLFSKLRGTFVDGYILDSHIDGRLYGSFKQLRGGGGGTRSGRFSSANPNLQNIPSRDPVWAPILRGLFVPDYGHNYIWAIDYSQIEYRGLAHFAIGPGSEELRAIFNNRPDTDYHAQVQSMVEQLTGRKIPRKPIKNLNFGLLYGMGKDTLAQNLHLNAQETNELFDSYHAAAPYVKATMDYYMAEAGRTGEITTLLGRKSRFDLWQPAGYRNEKNPALSYGLAKAVYGSKLQRAATHKAVNRVLQGSAADVMKMGMLKCYKAGLFTGSDVPRLTVHDEVVFSKEHNVLDDWGREVSHTMCNAIPMKIPLTVDIEMGSDWGHVKEVAQIS